MGSRALMIAAGFVSLAGMPALADSSDPVTFSGAASGASVQAVSTMVGAGVAVVGTVVAVPGLALMEAGGGLANASRPDQLPLGKIPVVAGPAPDQALRR